LCTGQGDPILSGMQPSSDWLADDNGGVRASDAERDRAIGELQSRFAEGRLSQEEEVKRKIKEEMVEIQTKKEEF